MDFSTDWQSILTDIAGGKSLRKVCKERDIAFATLYRWIDNDVARAEQYAQAMFTRGDNLADEIDDLAQEAIANPQNANAYRVAIDAKKWIACKLVPKKYGDKITADIGKGKVTLTISDSD
jgi:hypothetical protein